MEICNLKINYIIILLLTLLINIYNILGQKISTIFKGLQEAGPQSVKWDGNNDSGIAVSSGLYFYRLETPSGIKSLKALKIK